MANSNSPQTEAKIIRCIEVSPGCSPGRYTASLAEGTVWRSNWAGGTGCAASNPWFRSRADCRLPLGERDLAGPDRRLAGQVEEPQEQYELLTDILDTISEVNLVLRSIIRDQGDWDRDRLEERTREILGQEVESPAG
jgi:hypothetical protein